MLTSSNLHDASISSLDVYDISRPRGNVRAETAPVIFGSCELRIDKRELLIDGVIQRVQPRVLDLLLYLVEHRDRVVTRDELLEHVWKNAYVSDSVIGRCVMKARRVNVGFLWPIERHWQQASAQRSRGFRIS